MSVDVDTTPRTDTPRTAEVAALVERWLAESESLDFGPVRSDLDDRRLRLRMALAELPAPSKAAKSAFVGDATDHYEEHLEPMRSLASGSG